MGSVRCACIVPSFLSVYQQAAAAAEAQKLDYKIQPQPLNLNDTLLAAVTQDLSDIMAHHLFSDILNREPLEIRADARDHEAGYQVTSLFHVFQGTFARSLSRTACC